VKKNKLQNLSTYFLLYIFYC